LRRTPWARSVLEPPAVIDGLEDARTGRSVVPVADYDRPHMPMSGCRSQYTRGEGRQFASEQSPLKRSRILDLRDS